MEGRIFSEATMVELLAQQAVNSDGGGGMLVGGAFMIVVLLIVLVCFAIWLWALIDAIRNPALESTMRIVWILVIVFTGIIGAAIYLLVGRSRGPAVTG
jgi:hypothetical protein